MYQTFLYCGITIANFQIYGIIWEKKKYFPNNLFIALIKLSFDKYFTWSHNFTWMIIVLYLPLFLYLPHNKFLLVDQILLKDEQIEKKKFASTPTVLTGVSVDSPL